MEETLAAIKVLVEEARGGSAATSLGGGGGGSDISHEIELLLYYLPGGRYRRKR